MQVKAGNRFRTDDGKSRAVSWAWHGDWVAFVRQVGDSSQWQLHVMKADSTEVKPACPKRQYTG